MLGELAANIAAGLVPALRFLPRWKRDATALPAADILAFEICLRILLDGSTARDIGLDFGCIELWADAITFDDRPIALMRAGLRRCV